MHDQNCMVTLTYADENLPANGSLSLYDWQRFMKRLRWHAATHMNIADGIGPLPIGRPRHPVLLTDEIEHHVVPTLSAAPMSRNAANVPRFEGEASTWQSVYWKASTWIVELRQHFDEIAQVIGNCPRTAR